MFLITLPVKCMEQFFDLYQNKDLTFFLHRISYIIYRIIGPDSTWFYYRLIKNVRILYFWLFFRIPHPILTQKNGMTFHDI